MPKDRLRVFVSSKMAELQPERVAVKTVLDALEVDAWVFEKDAGARPDTIREAYKDELDACDLYVGVFWKGYGRYTVDEFDHAQGSGKDCLVYLKGGDSVSDRDPELQVFLERINDVNRGVTIQWFETPDELAAMLKRDAARWQMRIVREFKDDGGALTRGLAPDSDLGVLAAKVRQFWIDGVLARSVAATGLLDLGRVLRPRAGGEDEVVASATSIDRIYEDAGRSLLIVGSAGSGKTTMGLDLARRLLMRTRRDAAQAVPTVLNLSAWTSESTSLDVWISRELSRTYQIPQSISRGWIQHDRLTLILDGLDEVAEYWRPACVEAINDFAKQHPRCGLLLTSRTEAYEQLENRLNVHGTLELRPLEVEQIDAWLGEVGPPLAGLREVLAQDPSLQDLAKSPLMLRVMSEAYRDRSAAEIESAGGGSEEVQRAHLFESYVDHAFASRGRAPKYSREATTSWLAWIARGMKRRSRTVFLIEDLEPDWLTKRLHNAAYLVGFALFLGVLFSGVVLLYRATPQVLNDTEVMQDWREPLAWILGCLLWCLGIGLTDAVRFAGSRNRTARGGGAILRRVLANIVVFGGLWVVILLVLDATLQPNTHMKRDLPFGLRQNGLFALANIAGALMVAATTYGSHSSITRRIQTTESLWLDGAALPRAAGWGVLVGVFMSIWPLMARQWGWVAFWMLISVLMAAVVGGYRPRVVKGKTAPNQGMLLTLKTCLRASRMALVLAGTVALFSFFGNMPDTSLLHRHAIAALIVFGVLLAMWFGAVELGKHAVLRGVIGASRQGPWDFAHFLGETTRSNLTQRVGGGFLFLHRPLLEYFAALSPPPPRRDAVHSAQGAPFLPLTPVSIAAALVGAAGGLTVLLGLYANSPPTLITGAVVSGVVLLWLIVHTAVLMALRSDDETVG